MAESSTDRVHPHTHELREPDGTWKYTNRLADQTSPYLLQHAHNPVDWHAWGPEAFERARREGKPIFLSVGYSTCYWCHVMERQVFENPVIAEQMNRQFVNVKVDREERPDVDDLYMTATQMLSGHGGWPMSVFLTPPGSAGEDGEAARGLMPFWAGTYLPPEPTRGMPSFPQVLDALSQAWREQPGQVIDQAKRIAEAVTRHLEHRDLGGPLSVEPVERTANQLLQVYDHEHGGFGEAPKFPQPTNLAFMLAVYRHSHDEDVWHAVAHTLARMARGGIYDQVGGGFHRYSVDERWLVPHFEKMLYDNGQLVELYIDAYAERAEEEDATLYERVVRETCDYVLREMVDETGAFWSAQDAEVHGREGENYLWTREQIEQALDDPQLAALAMRLYGLDLGPNFQDPHDLEAQPVNVLHLPQSLPQLATELEMELPELFEARQRINDRLKIARDQRDQPTTDDKTLIAWNGMMIAGLARAGRILDEPRFLSAAVRAAEAILQHMTSDDHGLLRSMREGEAGIPAFLEDYVYFVHALIELHRAAPANDDGRYLQLARQYTEAARVRFAADVGGYYDTLADQGDLFVRVRMLHDGVIASGNSVMAHNLLDLYELTQQRVFIEQAVRDLHAFGQVLARQGAAMVHLQHALLRGLELAPELFEGDSIAAHSAAQQPVRIEIDPPDLDLSAGEASFVVTLHIDEQYHLNAEDPRGAGGPGNRNFMPTTLELTGPSGLALSVGYPDGEPRRFAYADQELIVYEGTIALHATLRQQSDAALIGPARLVLRYQACTNQACLAPQTLELSVPISSGASKR